jgi:hypothetical protein
MAAAPRSIGRRDVVRGVLPASSASKTYGSYATSAFNRPLRMAFGTEAYLQIKYEIERGAPSRCRKRRSVPVVIGTNSRALFLPRPLARARIAGNPHRSSGDGSAGSIWLLDGPA